MQNFFRWAQRIAKDAFAFALIYFALRLVLYHFCLVVFPYPNTLREGAMMTTTDALVKGLNPYAIEMQPQCVNIYGIMYPLLVWPWAKFFGTTMLVHRAVTAFFILASCWLIFFVLRRLHVPLLLTGWAMLMLYASLLYPGTSTPCIDPGAAGMFFFLLTVFVPWFCNYSYKSIAASVILGILGFYTKAYAFLGVPIIASYLFFFVSRIKGSFYLLLLLALSVLSITAVDRLMPAYFDDCFFTSVNMAHAWATMERLHIQLIAYWHLHQWTLILMAGFACWFGYKNFRLLDLRNPLPLVLYAGLCSFAVLYFSLGRHNGAMLWYFFQLLSPFLLIASAWLFSRHPGWAVICVPFLIYNLQFLSAGENYKSFDRDTWPQISLLISNHQRILNSPVIAPLLVEQHKPVVDNGMAEYFLAGAQRSSWMKNFFKDDPRVLIQQVLFFENIKNKIISKDFDLIMLQPSLLPLVSDDIKKFYKYEGYIYVTPPQDRKSYAVTVWKPR